MMTPADGGGFMLDVQVLRSAPQDFKATSLLNPADTTPTTSSSTRPPTPGGIARLHRQVDLAVPASSSTRGALDFVDSHAHRAVLFYTEIL
jgi:hypothetical protein